MNSLRRSVAQIVRSQSSAKRIVLFSPAFFSQPYSTTTDKRSTKPSTKTKTWKAVDWPKPSEIPFQVKVANSVNLIGYVDAPVQFQTSDDGKHWAGTVITQHESAQSPPLWIPILFEADLAHIAVSHLKKDDHVHIYGQLTADPPAVDGIEGQANIQVMVHSLNFITPASQTRNSSALKKQEAETKPTIDHPANSPALKKQEAATKPTIDHPAKRSTTKKYDDSAWRDLLDNPEQWRDYRDDKLKRLVNPRHPDFKRKDGTQPLWLNSAPHWVSSELGVQTHESNDANIDVQTYKADNVKKSEEDDPWKDLVENPGNWWDNRSEKWSEKSPDFKHKKTAKPLWLKYSPAWVKSQLPPIKSKGNATTGKRDTLLS